MKRSNDGTDVIGRFVVLMLGLILAVIYYAGWNDLEAGVAFGFALALLLVGAMNP